MLFGLPARVDDSQVPWVTYTDSELAHVGMTMENGRGGGACTDSPHRIPRR